LVVFQASGIEIASTAAVLIFRDHVGRIGPGESVEDKIHIISALSLKASALVRLGNLKSAIAVIQNAIELEPRQASLRLDHGNSLAAIGDISKAEEEWLAGLTMCSDDDIELRQTFERLLKRPDTPPELESSVVKSESQPQDISTCRFFGTRKGCRNGNSCRFIHEAPIQQKRTVSE
jgi:tetratricopeptide (TPR) repeat protein